MSHDTTKSKYKNIKSMYKQQKHKGVYMDMHNHKNIFKQEYVNKNTIK